MFYFISLGRFWFLQKESFTLLQDTATKRFNLVCSRSQYTRVAQTIFFVGTFIGVFACGFLSDIFGRMRTYL